MAADFGVDLFLNLGPPEQQCGEGLLNPFKSSCPSIPLCLCPIVNGWQTIPCSLLWLCGLLENMRGGDPSFSFSIRPNAVWLPWIYLSDICETILAKCYSWLIQILLMVIFECFWSPYGAFPAYIQRDPPNPWLCRCARNSILSSIKCVNLPICFF